VRLALCSDIHGNPIAFDAVLADVEARGGADHFWFLGDLVALGYDPLGIIERIEAQPSYEVIRGNTDRYVVTGERPSPWLDRAVEEPARLVPVVAEVAGSFAWTAGAISTGRRMDWLAALPSEVRATLPDGTRMLGVHASPDRDDGPGIRGDDPDADLAARLEGCAADVVLAGHTHRPVDRTVAGVRAVNLGSVSNPVPPDLRASYVMVEAGAHGHTIEHRRVAYDHAAVIAAYDGLAHPGRPWLVAHQRGEVD